MAYPIGMEKEFEERRNTGKSDIPLKEHYLPPIAGAPTPELMRDWQSFVDEYKIHYEEQAYEAMKKTLSEAKKGGTSVAWSESDKKQAQDRAELNAALLNEIAFSSLKSLGYIYETRAAAYGKSEEMFEGLVDITRYMSSKSKAGTMVAELNREVQDRLMNKWVHHEKAHDAYGVQFGIYNRRKEDIENNKEIARKYAKFFERPDSRLINEAVHGLNYSYSGKYVKLMKKRHREYDEEYIRGYEKMEHMDAMRTFEYGHGNYITHYTPYLKNKFNDDLKIGGRKKRVPTIDTQGINDNGEETSLMNAMPDKREPRPYERMMGEETYTQLASGMSTLDERELFIIKKRYGLADDPPENNQTGDTQLGNNQPDSNQPADSRPPSNQPDSEELKDGEPATLRQIARKFGITHERVRQLENGALDKLEIRMRGDSHAVALKVRDKNSKTSKRKPNEYQKEYKKLKDELMGLLEPFYREGKVDLNRILEEGNLRSTYSTELSNLLTPNRSTYGALSVTVASALREIIRQYSTRENEESRLERFDHIFDGLKELNAERQDKYR